MSMRWLVEGKYLGLLRVYSTNGCYTGDWRHQKWLGGVCGGYSKRFVTEKYKNSYNNHRKPLRAQLHHDPATNF